MKIAVMLRTLDEQQGVGVYARNLLSALLEEDKTNEYLFLYASAVQLGSFGKHANLKERLLTSKGRFFWDQVSVPKQLWQERVDLVFNTKFSVPLLAPANCVMVFHGSEWYVHPEFYKRLDMLYNRIVFPLYVRRATAISSVSRKTAQDMVRFTGVSAQKVKVIHSSFASHFGVVPDDANRRSILERYDIPDRYLLFVGKIYPGKNFGNILRAFARLRHQWGYDGLKLLSVGDLRWHYQDELQLVDQLGLTDMVKFTGWVEQIELPAIYSAADVFVFPSYYEGFGIPVLEAMACGCPVVTARTGACPEVAGEAAILVDPMDPDAIASAVHCVLSDSAVRDGLVEKGLIRAREFSWQRAARQTLQMFQEVHDSG